MELDEPERVRARVLAYWDQLYWDAVVAAVLSPDLEYTKEIKDEPAHTRFE